MEERGRLQGLGWWEADGETAASPLHPHTADTGEVLRGRRCKVPLRCRFWMRFLWSEVLWGTRLCESSSHFLQTLNMPLLMTVTMPFFTDITHYRAIFHKHWHIVPFFTNTNTLSCHFSQTLTHHRAIFPQTLTQHCGHFLRYESIMSWHTDNRMMTYWEHYIMAYWQ